MSSIHHVSSNKQKRIPRVTQPHKMMCTLHILQQQWCKIILWHDTVYTENKHNAKVTCFTSLVDASLYISLTQNKRKNTSCLSMNPCCLRSYNWKETARIRKIRHPWPWTIIFASHQYPTIPFPLPKKKKKKKN